MSRYKDVLNEIKDILGMNQEEKETPVEETPVEEAKLAQSTLEDGTVIYHDEGDIVVGTLIWADEVMETPVEDGTYVLENGDQFVTENGVIIEYKPLVEPEEEAEETEELSEEKVDFEKKYNDLLEIVSQLKGDLQEFKVEKKNLEKEVEEFKTTETKLKSEIEKLSAVPEVESVSQESQDVIEISQLEKRLNALEAIRKMRKK